MPRTLRVRTTADDVAFLQERLNAASPSKQPPLPLDRVFGPLTFARVQEFQRSHGLVADGAVGPLTWGALLGHKTTTSPGSFVLGRHLYDRLGNRVILRGVNKMCVFDNADPVGATLFPEIKKTHANTVRIVWSRTTNLAPNGPATSTATLNTLIANAKANHLIPMVELHDATGDWSRLNEVVNYWTRPAVVNVVRQHESYLLVNIGNEVGDETVTKAQFLGGYLGAILALRTAGIHTPLVIDASDWGKDLTMLNETASKLLAADPDYNLIFSVHLYWSMSCGADAAFIQSSLQQAAAHGYCLIVGEFSEFGGFPCGFPQGTSMCSAGGRIDYETILSVCHNNQIGWYAWEWGPGNDFEDPLCAVMDMTPDRLFLNLKPGWAHETAVNSPFSIANTAVTPPSV